MNQDIVIVSAARTAVGKFGGSLAKLSAPELGAIVIREAIARIAGVAAAGSTGGYTYIAVHPDQSVPNHLLVLCTVGGAGGAASGATAGSAGIQGVFSVYMRPNHGSSGTLSAFYGIYSAPTSSGGTITSSKSSPASLAISQPRSDQAP